MDITTPQGQIVNIPGNESLVLEGYIYLAPDDATVGEIDDALTAKGFPHERASVSGGFTIDAREKNKGWGLAQWGSVMTSYLGLGVGSTLKLPQATAVSRSGMNAAGKALQTNEKLGTSAVATATEVAVEGGTQIGQSSGKLGTVVENPGVSIANFAKHGLNQAITRGVNPSTILNTVKNPVTVLQQSGGNYLYLTREAAVVINPAGRVVSTYLASMFDSSILNVLKGF